MFWRRRRLPEPPTNVLLTLDDGTVLAVDTIYIGEQEGCHHWAVLNAPDPLTVRHMSIDRLPGRTMVTITEGFTGP